jgi:hypothetical protein
MSSTNIDLEVLISQIDEQAKLTGMDPYQITQILSFIEDLKLADELEKKITEKMFKLAKVLNGINSKFVKSESFRPIQLFNLVNAIDFFNSAKIQEDFDKDLKKILEEDLKDLESNREKNQENLTKILKDLESIGKKKNQENLEEILRNKKSLIERKRKIYTLEKEISQTIEERLCAKKIISFYQDKKIDQIEFKNIINNIWDFDLSDQKNEDFFNQENVKNLKEIIENFILEPKTKIETTNDVKKIEVEKH